jgi:hypothetical protein
VARGIRGVEGRSRFTTWFYPVVASTALEKLRAGLRDLLTHG